MIDGDGRVEFRYEIGWDETVDRTLVVVFVIRVLGLL